MLRYQQSPNYGLPICCLLLLPVIYVCTADVYNKTFSSDWDIPLDIRQILDINETMLEMLDNGNIPLDIYKLLKTDAQKKYGFQYYFFVNAMQPRYTQQDELHGLLAYPEYHPKQYDRLMAADAHSTSDITNRVFQYTLEYEKQKIITEKLDEILNPIRAKFTLDSVYSPVPNVNALEDQEKQLTEKQKWRAILDTIEKMDVVALDRLVDESKKITALLMVIKMEILMFDWKEPWKSKFEHAFLQQLKMGRSGREIMSDLKAGVASLRKELKETDRPTPTDEELDYFARIMLNAMRMERLSTDMTNLSKRIAFPDFQPDHESFHRADVPPKVARNRKTALEEYNDAVENAKDSIQALRKQVQIARQALDDPDLHPFSADSELSSEEKNVLLEIIRKEHLSFDPLRLKEARFQEAQKDFEISLNTLQLICIHPIDAWNTIHDLVSLQYEPDTDDYDRAIAEYEKFVSTVEDYDGYTLPPREPDKLSVGKHKLRSKAEGEHREEEGKQKTHQHANDEL